MSRALTIVAARDPKPIYPEPVAQRIRALQTEARRLAAEHTASMAAEITTGGEAYPPGVRSIARDIALSCERQGMTLQAINGRSS